MLCTFIRPLTVYVPSQGLFQIVAAYAQRIERRSIGGNSLIEYSALEITMVLRCDGQKRDLSTEPITVIVQQGEIAAMQDTRLP